MKKIFIFLLGITCFQLGVAQGVDKKVLEEKPVIINYQLDEDDNQTSLELFTNKENIIYVIASPHSTICNSFFKLVRMETNEQVSFDNKYLEEFRESKGVSKITFTVASPGDYELTVMINCPKNTFQKRSDGSEFDVTGESTFGTMKLRVKEE